VYDAPLAAGSRRRRGHGRQRGQGRQRGGNNNNNGGGNFDPAQMRERYLLQIKEQLASPDEEWKLIQPKLDKVLAVQRESRGSGRTFGGGRTRGGNQQGQPTPAAQPAQPQSEVATASDELRKAVADKATPPEELTKKIAALREAKAKAKANLAAAQKDLRELLSARQEATLISSGILG